MAAASLLVLLSVALAPACAVASSVPVLKQLPASQFTGFLRLLEQADLLPEVEAALKSPSGLTIFAPTDDALLYHTSPTLLAFLRLPENRATLRQTLLAHMVPERLSPFQWEGAHRTLAGTPMPLSMDAQAFYAFNAAVMQYNAIIAPDAAVHSLPALIIPSGVAGDAQQLVQQGMEQRRVLQAFSPVPAPAPATGAMGVVDHDNNAASSLAASSIVSAVAAVAGAAALLLC